MLDEDCVEIVVLTRFLDVAVRSLIYSGPAILSVAQLLFRNVFDVRLEIEVYRVSLVTPKEDVL